MTYQEMALITQSTLDEVKQAARRVIGNKHKATQNDINNIITLLKAEHCLKDQEGENPYDNE